MAFRPASRWGNRRNQYYARFKLTGDPLYRGVLDALPSDGLPVLDLGCGLGLLAHVLRQNGRVQAYTGVDLDTAKIRQATCAAAKSQLPRVGFAPLDLRGPLPPHSGHVALLDVLQYLDLSAQRRLLGEAAAAVAPGGRLILRTPLANGDARDHITRLGDRLAWQIGWMRSRPHHYPVEMDLHDALRAAGLQATAARPLHGRTPFNSWFLVAERPFL